MDYSQTQLDEIRGYIRQKGYMVNENGCEIWNSSQLDRPPCYRLTMENGEKRYVNIRTFLWMDANEGSFVKNTHSSCGAFTCIKLDHLLPGRKKKVSRPYTFNEIEVGSFHERIEKGVKINEKGCHIWGGTLIHGKIPCLRYGHTRNICIGRFLWTRENDDYDPHSKGLTTTCGEDKCVNIDHLQLTSKKKVFDRDRLWKLMLKKTTRVDDCIVMNNTGVEGYGCTNLAGVVMASHRASYILNKNNGEPIPATDENGNRLVVRHLCHKQPGCVSPDHLELGTQIKNSFEDKKDAGTLLMGENHPSSKITKEVAQKIKNSLREVGDPEYLTKKERAQKFGTTKKTVEAIDYNNTWAHLPDRFGVVKSNEEQRTKARNRKRLARANSWTDQDFIDAGEKIKKNIQESEEGKAGTFPPGPCWLWELGKNSFGYGTTTFKGRETKSHILSLESKYKRFQESGEVVRHLCANPPCSNPSHLLFGTREENAKDIQMNGKSKSFKVDRNKVIHIRSSDASNKELAQFYGIHPQTVENIRSKRTWSSID